METEENDVYRVSSLSDANWSFLSRLICLRVTVHADMASQHFAFLLPLTKKENNLSLHSWRSGPALPQMTSMHLWMDKKGRKGGGRERKAKDSILSIMYRNFFSYLASK